LKTGVLYISDDDIQGVNVVEEGKKFKITDTFSDLKGLLNTKKPIIGLPFEKFITKTVKLPKLTKDELKNAVELQEQFILGESGYNQYLLNSTLIQQSNGYMLFIVAADVPEDLKKLKSSVIIPAQLGLYAYAYKEKLIDHKKSIMLVYAGSEYTHLLVISELNIVFMRTFTSKSDINSEIRLSEQAVYLQQERFFLAIDEYIVFSNNDNFKKKLNISDDAVVRWIDTSVYNQPEKELIIPLGLSFFQNSAKHLVGWNVAKKPLTTTESLKRSLYWIAPILLLFLPVYYYADYYNDQKIIGNIKSEIAQYSESANKVDMLAEKLRKIEDILLEYAGPCLAYAKFDYLLRTINSSRPKNLWLTNISGKVTGDIIITGFAGTFSEISFLINKLNESELIKNVNLNYSNASNAGKVNFQLTVRLNPNNEFVLDDLKELANNLEDDNKKPSLEKQNVTVDKNIKDSSGTKKEVNNFSNKFNSKNGKVKNTELKAKNAGNSINKPTEGKPNLNQKKAINIKKSTASNSDNIQTANNKE
jgi:Tfp pilus assembly protein PilN